MRNLFSLLFVILVTFGLMIQDADARRFGGGRSFGMSRSTSSYSRVQPMQAPRQAGTTNKWLGPLAGLAAGGLLASLFMGHGVGGGILSWLLVFGGVMFLVSLFRNKIPAAARPAQYNGFGNVAQNPFSQFTTENSQASAVPSYPLGFDAEGFSREAKVQFIRLQAAYDTKNLNDLREFTTPEVFAEIQLQLHERGDATNQTEVVSVNTELLDVSPVSQGLVASVIFSGLIRENPNESPTQFNETWHFQKDNLRPVWLVAGIQQQ